MHPKERYEQIITSKLETLPLPDMADTIWARIEQQLDMDMPTDDGGDVPEPPAPSGGGGGMLIEAGMLAVIGALIAFLYFQKPESKTPLPIPQPQTIVTPPDTTASTNNPINPVPGAPPGTAPARQDNTVLFAPPIDSGQTGIVATPQLPVNDSVAAAPQSLVQTQVPEPGLQKTDSVPKKRRGVQGISDNDYRIIPKKDSVP